MWQLSFSGKQDATACSIASSSKHSQVDAPRELLGRRKRKVKEKEKRKDHTPTCTITELNTYNTIHTHIRHTCNTHGTHGNAANGTRNFRHTMNTAHISRNSTRASRTAPFEKEVILLTEMHACQGPQRSWLWAPLSTNKVF